MGLNHIYCCVIFGVMSIMGFHTVVFMSTQTVKYPLMVLLLWVLSLTVGYVFTRDLVSLGAISTLSLMSHFHTVDFVPFGVISKGGLSNGYY